MMLSRSVQCLLVVALLIGNAWANPALYHASEHPQLAAVSEISSRLAEHAQRGQDARLPIPTPQDLEAIKKVAQILIMLGEQVIPTIIGEPPSAGCDQPVVDVPADPVNLKDP